MEVRTFTQEDIEKLEIEVRERFKGNNVAALIHYLGQLVDYVEFKQMFPDIHADHDNIWEMLETLFNLYNVKVELPSWMYCGE